MDLSKGSGKVRLRVKLGQPRERYAVSIDRVDSRQRRFYTLSANGKGDREEKRMAPNEKETDIEKEREKGIGVRAK